jgi:hypothetical protein
MQNICALVLHSEDKKRPPWQEDDRQWFARHPSRSHRLRPMFPGELFSGSAPSAPPAPRHSVEVLVRQIQPGMRSRLPFFRNLEVGIPDCEPLIHALYDVHSDQTRPAGSTVGVAEVAKIVRRYAAGLTLPQ